MITDNHSSDESYLLRKINREIKSINAEQVVQNTRLDELTDADREALLKFATEEFTAHKATIDKIEFTSIVGAIKPIKTVNAVPTHFVLPLAILGQSKTQDYVPTVPVAGTLPSTADVIVPPAGVVIPEGTPVDVAGNVRGQYAVAEADATVPGILLIYIESLDKTYKGRYEIVFTNSSVTSTYSQSIPLFAHLRVDKVTSLPVPFIPEFDYYVVSLETTSTELTNPINVYGQWVNCTPTNDSAGGLGITEFTKAANAPLQTLAGFTASTINLDELAITNLTIENLTVTTHLEATDGHFDNLSADNLNINKIVTEPFKVDILTAGWYEQKIKSPITDQSQLYMAQWGAYDLSQCEPDPDKPGQLRPIPGQQPLQSCIQLHSLNQDTFLNSNQPDPPYYTSFWYDAAQDRAWVYYQPCHFECLIYGNATLEIVPSGPPTPEAFEVPYKSLFQTAQIWSYYGQIDDLYVPNTLTVGVSATVGELTATTLDVKDNAVFEKDAIGANFWLETANNHLERHQFARLIEDRSDPDNLVLTDYLTFQPGWTKVIESGVTCRMAIVDEAVGVHLIIDKATGKFSVNGDAINFTQVAIKDGALYLYLNNTIAETHEIFSTDLIAPLTDGFTPFPGTPTPVLLWDIVYAIPIDSVQFADVQQKITVWDIEVRNSLSGAGVAATEKVTVMEDGIQPTTAQLEFQKNTSTGPTPSDNDPQHTYIDLELKKSADQSRVNANRLSINNEPVLVDNIAAKDLTDAATPDTELGANVNWDANHPMDGKIIDLTDTDATVGQLMVNGKRVDFMADRLEIKNDKEVVTIALSNGPYDLHQNATLECYGAVFAFDATTPGKGILFDKDYNIVEVTDLGLVANEHTINIQHIVDPDGRDVCYIVNSRTGAEENQNLILSATSGKYLIIYNPDLTVATVPYRVVTLPISTTPGVNGAGDVVPVPFIETAPQCNLLTGVTRDPLDADGRLLQHRGYKDPTRPVFHSLLVRSMTPRQGMSAAAGVIYNLCLETGAIRYLTANSPHLDGTVTTYFTTVEIFMIPIEWESWEAHPDYEIEPANLPRMRNHVQLRFNADGTYNDFFDFSMPKSGFSTSFDDTYMTQGEICAMLSGEYGASLHGTVVWAPGIISNGFMLYTSPDGYMGTFTLGQPAVNTGSITNYNPEFIYINHQMIPIQSGPMAGKRLLGMTTSDAAKQSFKLVCPAKVEGNLNEHRVLEWVNTGPASMWPNYSTVYNQWNKCLRNIGDRWVRYGEGYSTSNFLQYVNEKDIDPADSSTTIVKLSAGTWMVKSDMLGDATAISDPSDPAWRGGSGQTSATHTLHAWRNSIYYPGNAGGDTGWLHFGDDDGAYSHVHFWPDDPDHHPYAIPNGGSGQVITVSTHNLETNWYAMADARQVPVDDNGRLLYGHYSNTVIAPTLYLLSTPDSDGVRRFKGTSTSVFNYPGVGVPMANGVSIRKHDADINTQFLVEHPNGSTWASLLQNGSITGCHNSYIHTMPTDADIAAGYIGGHLYVFRGYTAIANYERLSPKRTQTGLTAIGTIATYGSGYSPDDLISFTDEVYGTVSFNLTLVSDEGWDNSITITDGGDGYEIGDTFETDGGEIVTVTAVDDGTGHSIGYILDVDNSSWTGAAAAITTVTPVSVHGSGATFSVASYHNQIWEPSNPIMYPVDSGAPSSTYPVTGGTGTGMEVQVTRTSIYSWSADVATFALPVSLRVKGFLATPKPNNVILWTYDANNTLYQITLGDTTQNQTIILPQTMYIQGWTDIRAPNEPGWGCWWAHNGDATYYDTGVCLSWNAVTQNVILGVFPYTTKNIGMLEWNQDAPDGSYRSFVARPPNMQANTNGNNAFLSITRLAGYNEATDYASDEFTRVRDFGRTLAQTASRTAPRSDLAVSYNYAVRAMGRALDGCKQFRWESYSQFQYIFLNGCPASMRKGAIRYTGRQKTRTDRSYNESFTNISYAHPHIFQVMHGNSGAAWQRDSMLKLYNTTTLYYGPLIKRGFTSHIEDPWEFSPGSLYRGGPIDVVWGVNQRYTNEAHFGYNFCIEGTIASSPVTNRQVGQHIQKFWSTMTAYNIEGTTVAVNNRGDGPIVVVNDAPEALGILHENSFLILDPKYCKYIARNTAALAAADYDLARGGRVYPHFTSQQFYRDYWSINGINRNGPNCVLTSYNQKPQQTTQLPIFYRATNHDSLYSYLDGITKMADQPAIDYGREQRIPQKQDGDWTFWTDQFNDPSAPYSHMLFYNKATDYFGVLSVPSTEAFLRFGGNGGIIDLRGNFSHFRVIEAPTLSGFTYTDVSTSDPPYADTVMTVWLTPTTEGTFLSTDPNNIYEVNNYALSIWYDALKKNDVVLRDITLQGRTTMESAWVNNTLSAQTGKFAKLVVNGFEFSVV